MKFNPNLVDELQILLEADANHGFAMIWSGLTRTFILILIGMNRLLTHRYSLVPIRIAQIFKEKFGFN